MDARVGRRFRNQGRWRSPALGLLLAATVVAGIPSFGASPGGDIIRVEEDWILVLNDPEESVGAPQFHTAIFPVSDLEWLYGQITWNYWELPEYQPGGLQLQAWSGDHSLYETSFGSAELSNSSETITWTQSIATNGTLLKFSVQNGESETWGSFGGNTLTITGPAFLTNLNMYRPTASVENSAVTYGANRVEQLGISQVRYYSADGLVAVDNTFRSVYLP